VNADTPLTATPLSMEAAAKRIVPCLPGAFPLILSSARDAMPLFDFLTLYVQAGLWTLLALPTHWFRRIVQIALGVRWTGPRFPC
jgi:hypothetical protein